MLLHQTPSLYHSLAVWVVVCVCVAGAGEREHGADITAHTGDRERRAHRVDGGRRMSCEGSWREIEGAAVGWSHGGRAGGGREARRRVDGRPGNLVTQKLSNPATREPGNLVTCSPSNPVTW